jgi:antitoxin Phd
VGIWNSDEARERFDQVVDNALKNGPQIIARQDDQAVIILFYAEYRKLTTNAQGLSDYFRASPIAGTNLDLRCN